VTGTITRKGRLSPSSLTRTFRRRPQTIHAGLKPHASSLGQRDFELLVVGHPSSQRLLVDAAPPRCGADRRCGEQRENRLFPDSLRLRHVPNEFLSSAGICGLLRMFTVSHDADEPRIMRYELHAGASRARGRFQMFHQRVTP
jgi:hypothetical protein